MGKGLDTGKTFWQGVLSKITDPEQRAAAEKLASNVDVMTVVGNGVEGQSEIDRRLQELTTKTKELETQATELRTRDESLTGWQQQLTDWRTTNDELVRLGKQAKDAKWDGKSGAPALTATPTVSGVTEEALRDKMQELTNNLLGYDSDKSDLTTRHFNAFKELLDVGPLLRHPKIRDIGLRGVYDEVYKEKLAAHATAVDKAKEDAIRADERAKTLASAQAMPYVSPTGVSSGSPLDALKPADAAGPLVDQAVTEYNRLQTARVGSAA